MPRQTIIHPVAMRRSTTPATAMPTLAPRVRGPELVWWKVDTTAELFTIEMWLVEKRDPERERVPPSAGF